MTITTFQYQSHRIRVIETESGPRVMAVDLARAIGHSNTTLATKSVPHEEKERLTTDAITGKPITVVVLSKAGAIAMLLSKRSQEARAFFEWCINALFPQVFEENDEPEVVTAYTAHFQQQASPWSAIAVSCRGEALYADPDGRTFWATQAQIAGIYGTTVRNVGKHLKTLFSEGFLIMGECVKVEFLADKEGDRIVTKRITLYSFRAICAVGDRVSTEKGQAFRDWRADYLEAKLAAQDEAMSDRDRIDARTKELEDQVAQMRQVFHNPDAVEETIAIIKKYQHFEAYNEEIFQERLDEGLDPFSCEVITSPEHGRLARRRLEDFRMRCRPIREGRTIDLPRVDENLRLGIGRITISKLGHKNIPMLEIPPPKADPADPDGLEGRAQAAHRKALDGHRRPAQGHQPPTFRKNPPLVIRHGQDRTPRDRPQGVRRRRGGGHAALQLLDR